MSFLLIFILYLSITVHEYSHSWMAYKLGDPTPKDSGRLTLNPIAHIDLFGTIILPFLLFKISNGRFSFGYAKPVPINPYHFKNPKKDIMWVGIAGPLANLLIAIFLTLIFKILPTKIPIFISEIVIGGLIINLSLAIFNLIPIPPLDGSRVISAFLPYNLSHRYMKMQTAGFFIIALLIMTGILKWFIFPLLKAIISFLGIPVEI
jgi:Zn-dependent protease